MEIPGADGYFGVLPGHTPLLAMLGVGELWYRQGQEKHYLSIAFGFAEVQPDRVTILAQIAEKARRNRPRARRSREEARRGAARQAELGHGLRAGAHRAAQVADPPAGRRVALESARRLLAPTFANLVRYRGLISSLVARELKARYRGSVLGFFWSFINPLLLLLDLLVRVHDDHARTDTEEPQPYALFMFCGILPWTWFSRR